MGSNLPKNWVEVNLESIVDKMTNGANLTQYDVQDDQNKYPISRIETISDEIVDFNRVKYVNATEEHLNKYSLKKGDILFSHINSDKHLGKTAIFDFPKVLLHGINLLLIRTNSFYNPFLLNYGFKYYRLEGKFIEVAQRAVNQSSINQSKLRIFSFPLPPLTEQQRIVAKLDALFSQLETIKKSLDNVPVLLKNFRQQVLTQAVTGKLTEEWREGKELESIEIDRSNLVRNFDYFVPSEWKVYAFSDVADIKSNLVNPDEFLDYPLIAPDNIEALSGKLISKPLTSEIRPISGKHFFKGGSIIYSKIRPYLSKVILAEFDGLCSADMYPVQAKFNTKYLLFYMLSEIFLSYANTAGERSVLPKINQKGLNIIPVPMPPLEEQQEIVRRIDSLFAKANAIETQYTTLKEKIDKLPQAILHKAFKGELTQQLDTDGDARELLREIELFKTINSRTKKSKL